MTSKTPKYALRKLSIGVTSVVLGMIVTNLNAHADDTNNQQPTNIDSITTQKETQQPYTPTDNSNINSITQQNTKSDSSPQKTTNNSVSDSSQNTNSVNQGNNSLYTVNKTTSTTNVVDAQRVRHVSITMDGQTNPQYRYSEHSPASLTTWKRVNVSGQYDIDAGQLKTGNKIKILTFSQKPEYYDTIAPQETTKAYYSGQEIGYYEAEQLDANTLQLNLILTKDINAIGMQVFAFNNIELARIHFDDGNGWSKLGNHQLTYTDYSINAIDGNGQHIDNTFRIYYKFYGYGKLPDAGWQPNLEPDGFLSTGGASINIHGLDLGFNDKNGFDKEKSFIQSNGKDASGITDTGDKIYGIIVHQPNNNTWIPNAGDNSLTIETRAPYVNSKGEVSYDYGADPFIDNPKTTFNVRDAGKNLTFQQLADKNFIGGLYSQQSNGDYIYCYHFPRDRFKFTDDQVINNLKKNIVFNAVDPSNQALQNTLNFWHNNLKNMPTQSFIPINGYMADQTTKSNIKAEIFNVDGYQLTAPITMDANTNTSNFVGKGQSQIKLRVIDANTGKDVIPVAIYIGWPTHDVTINIPQLKGYTLIANDDSKAQAIFNKFSLSGQLLSSVYALDTTFGKTGSTITYYLIAMPNKASAIINFVDQDTNKNIQELTIDGQVNDQISNEAGQASNIINSLIGSGKYDLVSNDLDKHPVFTNEEKVYNIYFKHHIDSVHRHYEVVENLPNITQKTVIDVEATLYKDANVDYYSEGGAYVNGNRSNKLLKANEFVVHAGSTNSSDTNTSWFTATIDTFSGYNTVFTDPLINHYKKGVRYFESKPNQINLDIFDGSNPAYDTTNGGGAIDVLQDMTFYIDYVQIDCPTTFTIKDGDTGNILYQEKVIGKAGDTVSPSDVFKNKFENYELSRKYIVQSNPFTNLLRYSTDVTNYDIVLKHDIDSTTRHYRVIENLPNGTQQVIIDLTAILHKDATQDNWTGEGAYLNNDYHQKMLKQNEYIVKAGINADPSSAAYGDFLKAKIDQVKGYNAKLRDSDNFHGQYNHLVMTDWDTTNNQIWFDLFYRAPSTTDHTDWTTGPEIMASRDFYIDYEKQDCPTTFVIKDGDTGDIIYQETVVGKYGDPVSPSDTFKQKIQEYANSGKYVPKTNPQDNHSTYSPDNPSYDIVFTHKINNTNKHYRVVEDLPDGTSKTVIDLTATLYQDANSNVWQADGAHVNGTGALLRQNEYHINKGTPMQSNDDTYLKGNVDIIPGYTAKISNYPDNTMTNGLLISLNNSDAYLDLFNGQIPIDKLPEIDSIHISYEKNQYPVVINYYDIQGNLISTNTQKYYYLEKVNISTNAPKNYILLAGQKNNLTVGYDTNELDLIVMPKINYTTNQAKATRMIYIVKPNGSITTVQQEVNFSQTIGTNAVTNQKVSQSDWTPIGKNHFSSYSTPIIDGYTATNIAQSQEVRYGQNYDPIYLTYEKNATVKKPKYIDTKGNTYNQIPQGYQIANGQNSNGHDTMLIIKQQNQITIPTNPQVTRIVTITMPNGHTRTVKQTSLKGKIFSKVSLPVLHGYKAVINGNIGKAVADNSMTATVVFKKI